MNFSATDYSLFSSKHLIYDDTYANIYLSNLNSRSIFMKKILCFVLAAIMCVALVSCTANTGSSKILFVTGGEQGTYYA